MSHQHSYMVQAQYLEADAADPERLRFHESWLRKDTADYWRHNRMYEPATYFADKPELSWLTVGDGRFGLDSVRLRDMGVQNVLPTDISDALLAKAQDQGLIEDYRTENAEALSFADNSFDVVFCKEAYHHLPRAPVALFEMIRVARHAVILIEPRDYIADRPWRHPLLPVRAWLGLKAYMMRKLKLRGARVPVDQRFVLANHGYWEPWGNYIYSLSSREVEKAALGGGLPTIALKALNDYYIKGCEFEPADESSAIFREIRDRVAVMDAETQAGWTSSQILMAILFKTPPDPALRKALEAADWLVKDMPANPFLTPAP